MVKLSTFTRFLAPSSISPVAVAHEGPEDMGATSFFRGCGVSWFMNILLIYLLYCNCFALGKEADSYLLMIKCRKDILFLSSSNHLLSQKLFG